MVFLEVIWGWLFVKKKKVVIVKLSLLRNDLIVLKIWDCVYLLRESFVLIKMRWYFKIVKLIIKCLSR